MSDIFRSDGTARIIRQYRCACPDCNETLSGETKWFALGYTMTPPQGIVSNDWYTIPDGWSFESGYPLCNKHAEVYKKWKNEERSRSRTWWETVGQYLLGKEKTYPKKSPFSWK